MGQTEHFIQTANKLGSVSVKFRKKETFPASILNKLRSEFFDFDEYQRLEATDKLPPKIGGKLIVLATFFGEMALDESDDALIDNGLDLHIIEGFKADYRNNYRHLVLLFDACNRLGVSFQQKCNEASARATGLAEEHLIKFSGRPEELNNLKSFEIELVKKQDGRHVYRPV